MKDRGAVQLLSAFLLAVPVLAASPRDIEFAGITWGLRQSSSPANPGPTAFSNAENQVWVDEAGKLHITLQKRDEVWTGAELMAKKDAEYGTYRFDVDSSLHDLDPNIVFGFFTWDGKAAKKFNREIDIEIASWNVPQGKSGWFTVQPYDKAGNQYSFDLPPASLYSFEMRWEPGAVAFACHADGESLASWRFEGEVPDPGRARLRINLWLFKGMAPAGSGPYEIVVSNLRYEPRQ
ncbi:MAG TPA: glycoside hydrolase family 16 protein [Rectinemataceae bacterium]|nr:glycoside hydrolase family 16 protein [Rectinemataceae bacterium]